MKYFVQILLAVFLFQLGAFAQPQADPKLEKSLLWEITGNELQEPSYLYGTIHLIDKEDFFLTDATKKSMEDVDRITFEINMSEMSGLTELMELMTKSMSGGADGMAELMTPENMALLQKHMGFLMKMMNSSMMEGGKTLSDLLSKEDYKIVKEHFAKNQMPLDMMQGMKPMFLLPMGPGNFNQEQMLGDSSSMVSYEFELADFAEENEKEMAGLETIEFQMSIFDSIPYDVQAKMLVESIKASNEGEELNSGMDLEKLTKLYVDQDLQGMHEVGLGDDEELMPYNDLLLVNRNKNWIPIMKQMMTEKQTLFAVGAGHLPGKEGVINLLRQQGYTLKPLF